MRLSKSIKLAYNILSHSKLRSWLSIIGIVIGVASVIAIMSLGEGMQQAMEERLGTLGADVVTVSLGYSRAMGGQAEFRMAGDNFGGRTTTTSERTIQNLTNKEVQALKMVPNIKYIQGVVSKRADIGYLDQTISATVKGVDTKVWKDMETTGLDSGRYLTQGDSNVAVIGYNIATERFKQDIPINRQITIEGKPFRVVGVLKESEGLGIGGQSGSTVYIPIEAARTTLEEVDPKEFTSIEIRVEDTDLIEDTISQINSRLMLVRAENERTKSFSVSSVKEMQETISQSLSTMTLFLSAIAAIALLVGAVGIANTMFTTVLEKTKEIGIMKSIGAKNKDIMLMFLFNSGMVGLAGGVIGALVGIGASYVMSSIITANINMGRMRLGSAVVTPETLILILGLSIGIGILAGVIPAYRASKMNPVDALRYE
ncbi:MAG: ABC transporter permease [Candidatus Nanoarchaeia archaeon]